MPSGSQRHPAAHNSTQRQPAVLSGGQRQPVAEHKNWNIGYSEDYGTSSYLWYSIGQDCEKHSSPIGKSWMCSNGLDWVEDKEIRVKNDPGKLFVTLVCQSVKSTNKLIF